MIPPTKMIWKTSRSVYTLFLLLSINVFLFQAGQSIANACQAYGSGLFGAEAGQNAQFMIQSYSSSGEMLDGGGKNDGGCTLVSICDCFYEFITTIRATNIDFISG